MVEERRRKRVIWNAKIQTVEIELPAFGTPHQSPNLQLSSKIQLYNIMASISLLVLLEQRFEASAQGSGISISTPFSLVYGSFIQDQ